MREARKTFTSVVAGLALTILGTSALATDAAAQESSGGEIRVLVAPLATHDGIRDRFGERVADRVRDQLKDFSGMRPIEKKQIEDALKQYELEPQDMSPIEWRQLASRLNAGMVMVGDARRDGNQVHVEVRFVDPQSGDELPVESFLVDNDGQDREAARQISGGLEEQVQFQRSVVFCAEYLASEQLEDAARNCSQALAVNPNSTRALYLQGRVYMEQEQWGDAKENLERVLDENPSNTDAIRSLAFVETELGNTQRAQALYRDYLTFNPDEADVRLNVAFNLASAGAYAEAVEILEDGVERDSTNAAMWEYLGNVALAKGTAQGRPGTPGGTAPEAATPEEEATAPNGAGTVTDSAAIRLAVRAYDKVFELRGDEIEPAILTNVMAAHMELGDLEGALEFSERALERLRRPAAAPEEATRTEPAEDRDPADVDDEAEDQDETAEGEPTLGEPAQAEEEAEVPGRPEQTREQTLARIHDLRASIFSRMDRHRDALNELDRVLDIDPDYRNVLMRRGTLKMRTGDSQGALRDFRTAVERGQDPDVVANALFGRAYQDHFQQNQFAPAIEMFRTALEFARQPELQNQITFFTAYSYYQQGARLDDQNAQEQCEPARRALNQFQQVGPLLNRSGSYQQQAQNQLREALDVQIYRQEQIIRSACR